MVESVNAQSSDKNGFKCVLQIETDDNPIKFDGNLFLTQGGFKWQLSETLDEFEFPVAGFLVFAKQSAGSIYC